MDQANRRSQRKLAGQLAEELAARFLQQKGYEIVEKNWRNRFGELDLILRDGDCLVIVEVRSRQGKHPFAAVWDVLGPKKQMQVRRMAELYLSAKYRQMPKVRIDAVLVEFLEDGDYAVHHLPNAF